MIGPDSTHYGRVIVFLRYENQ